ncbi:class I SAM-dependent methyltransferase [Spirillospora sp. CA-255316]
MRADTTGKISLDHIYVQPDPRAYFSTLRELDYAIPQLAKPYFAKLVQEYRDATGVRNPTVLDIGCSYGINAALLRCDATMDELYDRYSGPGAAELGIEELLERDREMVRSRAGSRTTRFVGLDASEPALSYAVRAGFLDAAVHADLEENDPTGPQRERLAAADVVISTGCIGYVTERTIGRIVAAAQENGRRPWMAHFVLRMFPFDAVEETLAAAGYETVRADGVFRQRRFATAEEQSQVLDTLAGVGVDAGGVESEGGLYARLHISRPRAASDA